MRWLWALARAAASPLSVASLAAPLATVVLLASAGWIEGTAVAEARSVRVWSVAASLALVASIVRAAAARRAAAALAWAALALAAVQGVAAWAYRLDGVLEAGEGEQWPTWSALSFGPAAPPPDARLLALPEEAGGAALLEVDGRRVEVPVGREVSLSDGLAVRVLGSFAAPEFEVRRASGVPEATGLIKLLPGGRTWFEAGLLPHRFYVAFAANGQGEPRVRLAVQRGKVRVLDREVALGERCEVEGLWVAFGAGGRWSPVDVRRRSPYWPGLVAGALLVAAAAAAWGRRGWK